MTLQEETIQQFAEIHASKIEDKIKVVVKPRPKWMPEFVYNAVIKKSIITKKYK